jgi:hypothetical protein
MRPPAKRGMFGNDQHDQKAGAERGQEPFPCAAARIPQGCARSARDERSGAGQFPPGQIRRVSVKWVRRFEQSGSRSSGKMGGYKRVKLEPHRDFLERLRIEQPDVTLQALCERLLSEFGVKADTSMMSRFFRRLGVTFKKRRSSRASRIVRT